MMKPIRITIITLVGFLGIAALYYLVIHFGYVETLFSIIAIKMIIDFINTNYLRHKGKYPPKGQVSIEHVVRFVSEGNTILALKAYRELHNCGVLVAEKAIQQIKKEIQAQEMKEQGIRS